MIDRLHATRELVGLEPRGFAELEDGRRLYTTTLPSTPRSINALGTRGSWKARHYAKKGLQSELETYLMVSGLPRNLTSVVASAALRFPTRRRRDEGNFREPLEKALGDALVNGGWLTDDTPEHFRFERLEFVDEPGAAYTRISLMVSLSP